MKSKTNSTIFRHLFSLAAIPLTLLLCGTVHGVADGKPNIVLIMADDFGWGDASCNNPEAVFRTPNIDRIAEQGLGMTNAFAPHSVCTPTRYALLTGRYCWRTHVREGVLAGYGKSLIPQGRMTIASVLKQAGYRTGAFGKWHVGLDWTPVEGDPGDFHWGTQVRGKGLIGMLSQRVDHSKPIQLGPIQLGFDTCFITPSNNSRIPVFVRDDRVIGAPQPDATGLMRDPQVQRDTVDDYFVEEAIAFMDGCLQRHADQPFFVYLPLNAAHNATKAPKRFLGKSGDRERGDRCLWVDESVGKILAALDREGVADNTLVIFTSDNGPLSPSVWNPRKQANDQITSKHHAAGPYRGYKTDAWDGGFRVPFLVRWPGIIEPGRTDDRLLCLSDVLATFAALVDERLPTWAGEDSFNQFPVILAETETPARQSVITQSYSGVLSVRSGPWKLILDTKGSGGHESATPGFQPLIQGGPWEFRSIRTGQLYDIEQDPYETTDLFEKHPDVVEELTQYLTKAVSDGRTRP